MIRDLKNVVVHSTVAELRLSLGSAVEYYIDSEDSNVYWIRGFNDSEFIPHTTASYYAHAALTDGEAGEGIVGPQGATGVQGAQGATGQKGLQGANGLQGAKGDIGLQGMTGKAGTQGAVGSQGVKGNTGSQGAIGIQGITGLQGATGESVTGPQGTQGAIGIQGSLGVQGPIGQTGVQGLQGTTGQNGIQGAVGSQGPTGPQGSQGPIGPEDPNVVKFTEDGKVIQLPIDGSLSAVQDSGTGSAGVLVCQRNYGEENVTEIGNARNKLTLNATERPQIDLAGGGKEKMAYESDLIKYGMYYPGVKVDTKKLFALTKSSTEDDIKAALQLETSSGGYTLPTESILNDCLGKGYQLLSNWMPVNVTWNGAAWVFYLIGQTYMNEPNAVATVSIKITDGVYSVFQAAKVTKLADIDDLKLMPNVIRFPLRTLQDKVYTQEEILEWFGVTTVSELKQLIVSGGIYYLQYGISLSGNPMYYKMPVEYIAFESANQIKLAFTGLNTHNDVPAKYEILINLDGTILESKCNIRISMTELPTVNDLPSTADIEGNIEALISRVQSVENQLTAIKQTNIQAVDTLDSDVSSSDSDLVVSASATDKVVSLTGKSVQVKDTEVTNSRMNIVASNGDVNISNLTTSGTLAKSTANAAVSINNNDYVKITGADWKQSGYNAIEIGLTDGNAPKGVIIYGIDFASKLDNNCILIFAHQPNAVITISNCHIADASNFLRISNRTNVPATINLINCQIDAWDSRTIYQGVLILEDYTSASAEEAIEANRFANLTINFNNVVGPDGKIINPSDLSKVMGTGDANQIAYIYHDKGDGLIAYDETKYPKFTFK